MGRAKGAITPIITWKLPLEDQKRLLSLPSVAVGGVIYLDLVLICSLAKNTQTSAHMLKEFGFYKKYSG